MSQDKVTHHPLPQPIMPPIYKSFVGIWKRMFVSGRPDSGLNILFFNGNASCYGPIGPGSRIGGGTVLEVNPNPAYPQKGEIKIKFRQRTVIWTYTLNRNNEFKAQFHPLPGSNRTPPVLNELLLVGEGARHLYAFFSHPFRPLMTERELNKVLPV